MFQINVTLKQLGKKRSKIEEYPFILQNKPESGKELIEQAVKTCVNDFLLSKQDGELSKPITEEEIINKSNIGKIAFGINYGDNKITEQKALEVALQAFEDGLVRVFWKDNEIVDLEKKISIQEKDKFTFIRLTFITGGLWEGI